MHKIDPLEAEQGLLAAMLLDPTTIPAVESIVGYDDFERDDNRKSSRGEFFTLLVELHRAGQSIRDRRLVVNQLRATGLLQRLGGPVEFSATYAVDRVPDNAATYATHVREHSVRRQLRGLASRFSERVLLGEDDATSIAQWTRMELEAIESRASDANSIVTMGDACEQVIADIQAAKHDGNVELIETGVDHLDNLYGGLQPARLYVIAARPGGGKSCLSQQMGEFIADSNLGALFVSLEMSTKELATRYLARKTGINSKYIGTYAVDDDEEQRLIQASRKAQSMPFFINVPFGRRASVEAICAIARVQKATNDISVLLVDYLQITESDDPRRDEREYERVTKATRSFKQLSRELNIPVVILSQLNRDGDKGGKGHGDSSQQSRWPRLSDLRSSGSIEQDADCVMFLHDEGAGLVRLIVAKMRGAERSDELLRFDGPTCTFSASRPEDHPNHFDEFSDFSR